MSRLFFDWGQGMDKVVGETLSQLKEYFGTIALCPYY